MDSVNVIFQPSITFSPFDFTSLMLLGYLPAGRKEGADGNNGPGVFLLLQVVR